MLEFEGRVVVVTGGTGALGAAVVRWVVERGGRVVVPSHKGGDVKVSGPGSVEVVSGVDLSDEGSVEKFYGGLPGLWASVHAAGGFAMGKIATLGKGELMKMIETNAVTAFLCCREAVKKMRAAGAGTGGAAGGRIVNVAAKAGVHAVGGMVAYSMSKAAVCSLTESLAEEVAGEGIWVNAVLPSIMDTAANRSGMPGADFSKWPKVEEVAETVGFLASPRNGVTRGALVPVYGRS